jgi:ABC-type antimicrobial peptide transport system permease subunit
MENDNTKGGCGIGFLAGVTTLLFVILKLTHTIDWSWWWVFSPLLISIGFWLFSVIIVSLITSIIAAKK